MNGSAIYNFSILKKKNYYRCLAYMELNLFQRCVCVCVFIEENGTATSYCQESLETKQWDFTPGKTWFSESWWSSSQTGIGNVTSSPSGVSSLRCCAFSLRSGCVQLEYSRFSTHRSLFGLEEQIPVLLTVTSLLQETFYIIFSLVN